MAAKRMPRRPRAKKQKNVRATLPAPRRPRGPVNMLDDAAIEYARLLKDPCNAPLTRGVFAGSAGSLVSRFESDFIIASGATEVASIFAFCPGTGVAFNNATVLTTDTTASSFGFATGAAPGIAFLGTVAGSIRPLSACMQVSFPGTELNRSGIVALGVMTGATITPTLNTAAGGGNLTTTAASIRQSCQHTERMPQNMAEITWMPGSGDELAISTQRLTTTNAADSTDMEDRNLLVLSASGFPVSTGIRIRLVVVYEWSPRPAQGIVSSIEVSRSRNNVSDVVRALHLKDPNWYINAYKKTASVAKTVGSVISYGAKVLGHFI